MGRGRAALAAGLLLLRLGVPGALAEVERSRAAGTTTAHAEPAPAARADGPLLHPGPPCHEAHGPGAPAAPLALSERCPCGCGGSPDAALDHAGADPALLEVRPAPGGPNPGARSAASVAPAPAAPARSVDHVPIPA